MSKKNLGKKRCSRNQVEARIEKMLERMAAHRLKYSLTKFDQRRRK